MEENTPRTESGGNSGTRGRMREKAAGFAQTAKEKAGQQFQEKVKTASSELSSFASALRNAGEALRDGGSTFGATALNLLADRVEGLHSKVDDGALDDVIQFVDKFARRNSAAFVGTAFGLGFLAARFAKATSHRNHAATLDEAEGRPTTRRDQ